MKFTLFLLIIGCSCLWATSLNDNSTPSASLRNTQLGLQLVDGDKERTGSSSSILNNIFNGKKKLLCTLKEIAKVKQASFKFIIEISKCRTRTFIFENVERDVKWNMLANNIISTADDVLQINKKMVSEDSSQHVAELYNKTIELKDQIYEAANLKDKPESCAGEALQKWKSALKEFNAAAKKCFSP